MRERDGDPRERLTCRIPDYPLHDRVVISDCALTGTERQNSPS
jgi:hypothetical protein